MEVLADLNPSGSSDLLRVVKHADTSDTWYLQVSTNGGSSWSYLTASSGTAPSNDTDTGYHSLRICQDTSNYAVHIVSVATSATVARYHRITLAYTSSHISGWSWAAADVTGPSLANYGGGGAKAGIYEVIDGNSAHRLLIVGLQRVSSTRIKELVVAATTPTAGLAPSGASSWCKVTDYTSTSALDILGDYNTNTSTDSNSACHFTSQSTDNNTHIGDACALQLSNGDLHVITGLMYYNDQLEQTASINRWRYTVSGSDWSLDSGANGATVAALPSSGYATPCVGGVCTNPDKSVGYISYWEYDGLHIDGVNTSGTWTADVVDQPDTGTGPGSYDYITSNWCWGWSAIGCDAAGTLFVSYDRSYGFNSHALNDLQRDGYWDGEAWQLTDRTGTWDDASGWGDDTDGATTWAGIANIKGVGVVAYPYDQWDSGSQIYSSHVLTSDAAGSSPIELDGAATCGVSAVAAALTTGIALAAAETVGCTTAAALTTEIHLQGAASVGCATAGSLTTSITLGGACSAGCATAGALSTSIVLAGSCDATTACSAALTTESVLEGSCSAATVCTATLTVGCDLTGTCAASCVTAASLSTGIPLAATATLGIASTAANLSTSITLAGSTSPTCTCIASLTGGTSASEGNLAMRLPVVLRRAGAFGPGGAAALSIGDSTTSAYGIVTTDSPVLLSCRLADPQNWGAGIRLIRADWSGADAVVSMGSGDNSAVLETTAGGALVLTITDAESNAATRTVAAHGFSAGSTHSIAFGARDGVPTLIVDGVETGTLSGTAVLSGFPSNVGINSTVAPVAKTICRLIQSRSVSESALNLGA